MIDRSVSVITLDGPGGAGKGTLAAALARHLNWHVLDSGALYRLAGLIALERGLDSDNESDWPAAVAAVDAMRVAFATTADGNQRIFLDDCDVGEAIRRADVANAASRWAAIGRMRAALLDRQREMARSPGLVADGRDMGTVVFPDAALKFFVTASAADRARRRAAQLSSNNATANIERIYSDIIERDARDRERSTAPLAAADDALIFDTTGESESNSIRRLITLVAERGWGKHV